MKSNIVQIIGKDIKSESESAHFYVYDEIRKIYLENDRNYVGILPKNT